jgi:hypothetical protein
LLLHAVVHPADIQDRDGGVLVLSTLFGMYPFLLKLFVDGGSPGPQFHSAAAAIMPQLEVEIVKRSDQAKGFEVLPKRFRLAGQMSQTGKRLRESNPECCRLHSPRLHPPHAAKAMQSLLDFPDSLLRSLIEPARSNQKVPTL